MPILSMFYGIIVRMHNETGGKHNKPHLHANYGDFNIVVSIEGEVLEGKFPRKQEKILLAWIAIHADELEANWKLINSGESIFKIEPLR